MTAALFNYSYKKCLLFCCFKTQETFKKTFVLKQAYISSQDLVMILQCIGVHPAEVLPQQFPKITLGVYPSHPHFVGVE